MYRGGKVLEKAKEILKEFQDSNIEELEIEVEGLRVKARYFRGKPVKEEKVTVEKEVSEAEVEVPKEEVEENIFVVESPIVGTFYRAPAPGAEPFVKKGDFVEKGQTLCIIEALKVMNEIESEVSGKVVKILVENGQPVEYGQPLFHIKRV